MIPASFADYLALWIKAALVAAFLAGLGMGTAFTIALRHQTEAVE